MKRIKKLTLKKETIVNLNEDEMNSLKGGSSYACSVSVTALTYEMTKDIYNYGKDESVWNCPHTKQNDCMGDVSKKWVWYGNERVCELDEVVVYGYRP